MHFCFCFVNKIFEGGGSYAGNTKGNSITTRMVGMYNFGSEYLFCPKTIVIVLGSFFGSFVKI